MIGAIAGDIIGSIYEHDNIKSKQFPLFSDRCRFTDDTVCTIAVADCLMNDGDFGEYLGRYALRHPSRGYGPMFWQWASAWEREPYGSWGNGSAMRVSAVAHLARDETEVLSTADRSASATHNHPDAVNGARAVALTMWMALNGADAIVIRQEIAERFDYDLSQTVDEIRAWYRFDVSCAGTVPQAITCALEAHDYEDAIRNAISIGGDSDTVACIAGGIAEALYGVPDDVGSKARAFLTVGLLDILDEFDRRRSTGS